MDHKIVALMLILLANACGRGRSAEPGTGGARGAGEMTGASPPPAASSPPSAPDSRPAVLFFGTSLTAGLGLDPEQAYPALIQQKIDSAGLDFRTVNAGLSGETSAAGLRRIDWILQQPVSVLVLELGPNDALRGQDLAAAKQNLQEIINRTRARYPEVRIVVAGMQAPPNLGHRYTREFQSLFVELARENRAALIPFLLAGVGGVDSLNQRDGIHPNEEGEKMVADNVWRVLEPILRTCGMRNAECGSAGSTTGSGAGSDQPASRNPQPAIP